MPNLTSYHAPVIHLNRELPKTYCDLIQHEFDYIHFLRTRIANIQSSLASTNKKHLIFTNNIQQNRYFDDKQRLSDIYQHNLELCKRIFQIWNGERKIISDCHNENYKKQINISHFRLRQKRWKDKIESENKRFINSLIYHRKKYRPIHDRYTTYQDFKHHLKLLETMSQYSLNKSICKNLFNHNYLSKYIKFNKQKPQTNEIIKYKELKTNKYSCRSTKYIENILQKTINDAIHIYNQPLPSAPNRVKLSYSENGQWLKPRLYRQQKLFRSISCRQLLEPWRNTKQQRESLKSYTSNGNIIDKKSRLFNWYCNE